MTPPTLHFMTTDRSEANGRQALLRLSVNVAIIKKVSKSAARERRGKMSRRGRPPGKAGAKAAANEAYNACRLCGSGGGYKMPIVRGVPSSRHEPDLRQKIRECCSIDVREGDEMPQLICELCVDKVNDFYEFREMCLQTNATLRAEIGLAPQNPSQGEDCILGVSGPLIFDERSAFELESSLKSKRGRKKKNPDPPALPVAPILKKVKINPEPIIIDRPAATPQPLLLERKYKKRIRSASPPPQPPVKKLRLKNAAAEKSAPVKKSPQEKKSKIKDKKPPSPYPCELCDSGFAKKTLLKQHLVSLHSPIVFDEKFGCAPCREWFPTSRLAEDHHRWHKTTSTFYGCQRCSGEFKMLKAFNRHFSSKQCIPEVIIPDPVCADCNKTFPTENLLKEHPCLGPATVGNECPKCKRLFAKRIQLKKHAKICTIESPTINPNNPHLKTLKPIQIAVPKCDELLKQIKREPLDASDSPTFYDVSSLNIKSEPLEENDYFGDMQIKQEIKEECFSQSEDDNLDHDEDGDSESDEPLQHSNRVASLSSITLKTVKTMLKKKQKVRRTHPKIKFEQSRNTNADPFDSLFHKDCNESSVSNVIIASVEGGAAHFQTDEQILEDVMNTTENQLDKNLVTSSEENSDLVTKSADSLLNTAAVIDVDLNETHITSSIETNAEELQSEVSSSTAKLTDPILINKPDEDDGDSKHHFNDSDNNKLYEMTCSAIRNFVANSHETSDIGELELTDQSIDNVCSKTNDDVGNTMGNQSATLKNSLDAEIIEKNKPEIEMNEKTNFDVDLNGKSNFDIDLTSTHFENTTKNEINSDQRIAAVNSEIDFEIENMLQDELGQLVTKQQNETTLLTCQDSNNVNGEKIFQDSSAVPSKASHGESIKGYLNEEILKNGGESVEKLIIGNVKSDQEISNEKPEGDVFDLVSDSGDDCNIIDSPEKMKAMEEQLLAEEDRLLAEDNDDHAPSVDFELGMQEIENNIESILDDEVNFVNVSNQIQYVSDNTSNVNVNVIPHDAVPNEDLDALNSEIMTQNTNMESPPVSLDRDVNLNNIDMVE